MTPQELKNSILQLAIQGKLVEQRPEEGTAEELYKQIQAEKQKLIQEGRIKKEKSLQEIAEEEKPFDIPESWKWMRLGDYSQKITDQVASGSFASLRANVPSLKEPDYAIMVKTADFSNGFTRNLTYTDRHGYEFLENSNLFGGELILSNIGSIGKCFIVPKLEKKMTLAPNSVMVRLVFDEQRDYLYQFILSPQGYQELLSITSGTAMKKFNKTDLKQILIPVPPLAEQKRIVAKIEELLPLIDRYEKAWNRLEDFNKRFPDDMQKSILQLAIQGKLVEQRPEEGIGEALYQQIQKEKQALIKAGKIKKEKPLPEVAEEEKPFDIPNSWRWYRIGEVFNITNGFTPLKSNPDFWMNGDVPWFTIEDVHAQGRFISKTSKFITRKALSQSTDRIIPSETVLLCCTASVGEYAYAKIPLTTNQQFNAFVTKPEFMCAIFPMYIYEYAKTLKDRLIQAAGKTTFNYVSVSKLSSMIIPLPPLAEQKRIVAKLEELLPLCERMRRL